MSLTSLRVAVEEVSPAWMHSGRPLARTRGSPPPCGIEFSVLMTCLVHARSASADACCAKLRELHACLRERERGRK